MKAVTYKQYGSPEVLLIEDIDKPVIKDNEVLIKIAATAVNSGDVRLRKADPFMIRLIFGLVKPRIKVLGTVFSGKIESVGNDVKDFKVGDDVFGSSHMKLGTYAEYLAFPAKGALATKPHNLSHTGAAAIPFGATTALYWIKKAGIKAGYKVLVMGASGAVGTAAIQLARFYGAEVTAVCSVGNFELVKSLGAEKVIDYRNEDFTENGVKYDVIIDTVLKIDYGKTLKSLQKNGSLILSAAGISEMMRGLFTSLTSQIKVFTGVASISQNDMLFLKDIVEAGLMSAVIDRTYRLEEIAEAHAYVEKGHKKGNVAITL